MSRKRLGRIDPGTVEAAREKAGQRRARGEGPTVPIAQMAAGVSRNIDAEIQRLRGELEGATETLRAAEAEGRMLHEIHLDDIDPNYMTRDRRELNRSAEAWETLKASLTSRGQQTPIELADLGPEASPRYGLITGLRRTSALRELWEDTGEDRYCRAIAILRPASLPVTDRLVAMIEENEVRAGLSFYERGRIAALSVREGIFADADAAIETLFASANRNRRYKIRSFVTVFETLDGLLHYPEAIGERVGLQLAKAIRAGEGLRIRAELEAAGERSEHGEAQLLTRLLMAPKTPVKATAGPAQETRAEWTGTDGRRLTARARMQGPSSAVLEIEGINEIDADRLQALLVWLVAGRT